ncbi:MAG TPA: hypothetical protein VGQ76_26715 [Thermoanaerobaculia bacterium]|nr:hypothetical protein [Thermoanaerobaculia bacterium]
MRRSAVALSLVLAVLAAPETQALRLDGDQVSIPVVGRFPGAAGTLWQTDVYLSNPHATAIDVTVRFYPAGEAVEERAYTLPPASVLTLTDICLNTFSRAVARGTVDVITTGRKTAGARARIYNVGHPAGQFGQNVPGISRSVLSPQANLYGLSASHDYRLNIGITNPGITPAPIAINVRNKDGVSLYERTLTVQPHQYIQYNDVASLWALAPQEGLSIDINSGSRIYGWASEVRNDNGDAAFVFGLSPNLQQ